MMTRSLGRRRNVGEDSSATAWFWCYNTLSAPGYHLTRGYNHNFSWLMVDAHHCPMTLVYIPHFLMTRVNTDSAWMTLVNIGGWVFVCLYHWSLVYNSSTPC